MTLQLPYSDQASGCIYLDDKSPCGPDYYAYPIKGGARGVIPGLPGDYDGLTSFLNEVNNPQATTKNIADPFKCQADQIAPAVQALRYQVSTFCAQLVLWSLLPSNDPVYPNATIRGGGCILPTISGISLRPDGPLLCKDQCDIGVNGFANIIQDPELCTDSGRADERIARSEAVCSSFEGRTDKNDGCLVAVQSELTTCGFRSAALANTFCPALAATDSCCAALINPTSTSSNFTDTSAKSSTNIGKLAPIIGGVVGGIAVIAIIAVISVMIVRSRNKNKRRSNTLLPVVPAYASNENGMNYKNNSAPSPEFQTLILPNASKSSPQKQKKQKNQQPQQQNSAASINPWQANRAGNEITSESSMKQDTKPAHQPSINTASSADSTAADAAASTTTGAKKTSALSGAKAPSPTPEPAQGIESSTLLSDAIVRIIHPYEATLADELSLVLDNTIVVLKSFDDGWALGLDPKTGAQGAFPLICVVSDTSGSAEASESTKGGKRSRSSSAESESVRFSKRVSSAMLTAEEMNALASMSAIALTSESATTGLSISPAMLKARGVKFDSGVPNTVHVYPRESISALSSFSYSASDAGTDVTAQ